MRYIPAHANRICTLTNESSAKYRRKYVLIVCLKISQATAPVKLSSGIKFGITNSVESVLSFQTKFVNCHDRTHRY